MMAAENNVLRTKTDATCGTAETTEHKQETLWQKRQRNEAAAARLKSMNEEATARMNSLGNRKPLAEAMRQGWADAEHEALPDDTERTGPGGTGEAVNGMAETEWVHFEEEEAFNKATETAGPDRRMVGQDEADAIRDKEVNRCMQQPLNLGGMTTRSTARAQAARATTVERGSGAAEATPNVAAESTAQSTAADSFNRTTDMTRFGTPTWCSGGVMKAFGDTTNPTEAPTDTAEETTREAIFTISNSPNSRCFIASGYISCLSSRDS